MPAPLDSHGRGGSHARGSGRLISGSLISSGIESKRVSADNIFSHSLLVKTNRTNIIPYRPEGITFGLLFSCFAFGIQEKSRKHYWRILFKTLRNHPGFPSWCSPLCRKSLYIIVKWSKLNYCGITRFEVTGMLMVGDLHRPADLPLPFYSASSFSWLSASAFTHLSISNSLPLLEASGSQAASPCSAIP